MSAAVQEGALEREMRRARTRATWVALGRSLALFALMIAVVLVLWQALLAVFGVTEYVGKGPLDVWQWFTRDDDAGENRALVFGRLGVTLGHAFIGFVAGLVVALVVALLFQLSRGIEAALMPLAMLLRSVPLVAMAPVITLIFGRSVLGVAVIGAIVVLFPALVNIVFGLRSASPQMNDLIAVYGGGPVTQLVKVALPTSLPAFFAAVRISVPGAFTGALLAEWLATGDGIGGSLSGAITQAKFTEVWAAVAVTTAVALVLYNLVQILETTVLARMGMDAQRGV
ncbi:ABC transporter permease [Microbacterium karelineae]|uniref:ABC transporter permease n=1 Tax=Microbacterium karelineae TaxID=2654283 RepID=UPI001E308AD8|nr:ABC transporter permease subunit [Microbacterium karelineae]